MRVPNLFLIKVRISCERPQREHVSIGSVRDSARAVEDPGDALLRPVARRQLQLEKKGGRIGKKEGNRELQRSTKKMTKEDQEIRRKETKRW
jgi:hypothetical protein